MHSFGMSFLYLSKSESSISIDLNPPVARGFGITYQYKLLVSSHVICFDSLLASYGSRHSLLFAKDKKHHFSFVFQQIDTCQYLRLIQI